MRAGNGEALILAEEPDVEGPLGLVETLRAVTRKRGLAASEADVSLLRNHKDIEGNAPHNV